MNERVARIKEAAAGRWPELFVDAGMDRSHFTRQNRPCPLCGGTDRFSLFPKSTDGGWFCRGCGHGDGIALVRAFTGRSFPETLEWLERALGLPEFRTDAPQRRRARTEDPAALEAARRARLERLWDEAVPLARAEPDSPVRRYLAARGLGGCVPSRELRCVSALGCWETPDEGGPARLAGTFPAMIARVSGDAGELITLHRTYLTETGEKAPVRSAKKLAAGAVENGLVRLYPAGGVLCLAEGIETALSVHALTGLPCWSAISLTGFRRFESVPEGVRTLRICGDNDASYAGAAGAYELASRIKRSRPELTVTVHIPERSGEDWNDVLRAGGSLKL